MAKIDDHAADALDAAHMLEEEFAELHRQGFGLSPERRAIWERLRAALNGIRDERIAYHDMSPQPGPGGGRRFA